MRRLLPDAVSVEVELPEAGNWMDLLAVRYKTETGMVAASVLVSTLLAPLTTLAWLMLLGRA